MKKVETSIVAVLVLASCTSMASGRKWTDSTGKYTIEAEFVDFKHGKVQLEKTGGSIVSLPIERLSEADREFVKLQPGAQRAGSPVPPGSETAKEAVQGEPIPPKTKAYAFSGEPLGRSRMLADTAALNARGYKVNSDAKVAVRVSPELLVTGVPVSYIRACAQHARISADVRGHLRSAHVRWGRAKGFGRDWTINRQLELGGPKLSMRDLIYHDVMFQSQILELGLPSTRPPPSGS